jgi:hypothetical protein
MMVSADRANLEGCGRKGCSSRSTVADVLDREVARGLSEKIGLSGEELAVCERHWALDRPVIHRLAFRVDEGFS